MDRKEFVGESQETLSSIAGAERELAHLSKTHTDRKKHHTDEKDPLSLYLSQIAKFKLLSAAEEQSLGKSIQDQTKQLEMHRAMP